MGLWCGSFTIDPEVICRTPAENRAINQIQIANHF